MSDQDPSQDNSQASQPNPNQGLMDWLDELGKIMGPALQEHSRSQEEVISQINLDYDLDLEIHTPAAPVQIIGEVDGHYFYFRSRGNTWHCEVSKDEDHWRNQLYVFQRSGSFGDPGDIMDPMTWNYTGSWLEGDDLDNLLRQCLDEWNADYVA